MFRSVLVLLLVAAVACVKAPTQSEPTALPIPADDDRLGQGDIFEVRVFGEKDLGGVYQVTGEGSIDFPFVGEVPVAGKTPAEVGDALTVALRDGGYLVDPHVSVLLKENRSKRISVIGAVAKPGTFNYAPGLTVVQVITLAGGFSALADRDRTVVTRREGDTIKRYGVEVDAITRGGKSDFYLQPGDLVYVPERLF